MTTYQDIRSSRRLIWAGIGIGYALALALAIVNLAIGDGTPLTALAFLAMAALPPSLALRSLDQRPSLLTAASMAALVQGFVLLGSGVGLIEFVPAILWTMAGQRRPRPPANPGWATWVRPFLAVATVTPLMVMFLHLDPRCTITASDGSVISATVDVSAASGWRTQFGSFSSSSTGVDGVTRSCTSDSVQHWEAALSVVVSLSIVAAVFRSWPTASHLFPVPPRRTEPQDAIAVDGERA